MITAVFKMVGTNPPSILIVGGFMLIIFGVMGSTPGLQAFSQLTGYGIGAVAIGAILHVTWLWLRNR